ncbi:DHH family phosphoesterase [Entomospira culicis]|uniref:Bifunctional oligoribonuclease/PAP phosphatase NrnA n=1 Tax=Entomospira culicis TaxID=2719989 RepID=A0A968GFL3_9SPIO|nr:bifunctional oligoribonuclease/PAP phosphatase NrnA [Entomospira culicis]NIZ19456.1 bifunctional oligoribonuclease/PAP phosphatase NrnA [Entomospira culicis]NIZ69639.1 bifunctional oligoribonuclease/PAP phosphatase NrnA [Entomospira culicis]WDI36750.1 bifunctional oligoribonuclease/PAP phosphatase NrnA [Entomospira culicis]WDI38379.1 bifunctional oligoribonuclease/PAP phosphatase NrnA [Entomospira culicis]
MHNHQDLLNIVAFIEKYDRFLVLGHVAPDGDCIGSQLALMLFLRRLGKQAEVASVGPFNKNEVKAHEGLFMREITEEWADAAVFIVDCATFERTGFAPFGVEARSIDHHASVEAGAVSGLIDATSPSATLLVQRVIEAFTLGMSEEEAHWLFLGFTTDTGFFRHLRAYSGEHVRQASKLIDLGASPAETFALLEGGYCLRDRQYLGRLLASSQSFFDDKVIIVEDHVQTVKEEGAPSRDSDTLYRLLLSAEATEVVIVLRMDEEQTTVGLRSKDYVDVGTIAQSLGGGGHARASGCTVKSQEHPLADLKEYLLEQIQRQL